MPQWPARRAQAGPRRLAPPGGHGGRAHRPARRGRRTRGGRRSRRGRRGRRRGPTGRGRRSAQRPRPRRRRPGPGRAPVRSRQQAEPTTVGRTPVGRVLFGGEGLRPTGGQRAGMWPTWATSRNHGVCAGVRPSTTQRSEAIAVRWCQPGPGPGPGPDPLEPSAVTMSTVPCVFRGDDGLDLRQRLHPQCHHKSHRWSP